MTIRKDRRELPRYTIDEVARYTQLPKSTVRVWFFGQSNFAPLLKPASVSEGRLSFFNVVEAHAIAWTKRNYNIRLPKIRAALDFVREQMPDLHRPLVDKKFSTDGISLFIDALEVPPLNVSRRGQYAFEPIRESLELIEYDDHDLAMLLYPLGGERIVVINPRLSSGRPVVQGTGVLASIIWQRAKKANEPIGRLAKDYQLKLSAIKAAINYIEAAA